MDGDEIVVTSDGWTTTHLKQFRILTNGNPPRPWGYWGQWLVDIRSSIVLWLYAIILFSLVLGIGFVVAGFWTDQWMLLLGGLAVIPGLRKLYIYLQCMKSVINNIRYDPVSMGIAGAWDPHPFSPITSSVSVAMKQSGELTEVTVDRKIADIIARSGTHALVWFIDNPKKGYGLVFAFKALQDDAEQLN